MQEILIDLSIQSLGERGYLATNPDLPGLVAQGRTLAETLEIAQDVARKLVDSYQEHGDPLPIALQQKGKSRRGLRVPVSVS